MTRLTWSDNSDRYFDTGLDRGVLYPKEAPAVSWNGLTGVDENGADSATEFYMDGRPFLYLPKPKEFTASIKAYTYPDEFSALMGLEEITDGMYVDSQQPDSFGLCYRTLVGNAVGGNEANYKIHLIYNVTVSPQGASYQTLADSVNANEFSWEINAVPVAITGRRATAHIVIDTRHMDLERLADLEIMLYGDATNAAYLPDPQTIFEALSFGSGIVITDNGDGTWTAEGSYLNVYLLDVDTFEIDNVSAIGYGDGTYDITTTP